MGLFLRCTLQHWLNPLHIYCRLRDCGLPRSLANRLSSFYERFYRLGRWI